MTLEEWIALYEKKTGEKFRCGGNVATLFFPDRGFGQYQITEDMVIIRQTCGDGKFWKQVGEILAMERGIHHLGTYYIRKNILAYIRRFGFDIVRTDGNGERPRYYGKNRETGKRGMASPAFDQESGRQSYFITWEV